MSEPQDAAGEIDPQGAPSGAGETELRTFLIADIRGYTIYTREHGDEAAAALAARFAELVSEVVGAREGFLIELRGDEALVVFISARRALRAAIDMQARFADSHLPRGVGIGLDAGEAIPVGDGYRGSALNLAARLCAQAGPGEILASEAVIHLAAKMDGIAYVDARSIRLKGYEGAVRAVAVVPSDRAKGRRLASGNGGAGRDRRLLGGAVAGLAVAAVLVAAIGGGFFGGITPAPGSSAGPTGAPASASPSQLGPFALSDLPLLAFYDSSTGQLKDTVPVRSPRVLSLFRDGSFWQILSDPRSIDQIDPNTHKVVRSYAIPVAQELGFMFSREALWFTDQTGPQVVRVDTTTGAIATFPIGADADDRAQAVDIVIGAGSVWFTRPDAEEVVRMDPTTGEIQARIPEVTAFTIDFGEEAVWYTAGGSVGRIDPETNTVETPIEVSADGILTNMAFAGGFGWVSEGTEGNLYKFDRTGVRGVIKVRPGIGTPAATTDAVWLSNGRDGTLTRVDPITGETSTIDNGHASLGIAAGEGQLMVVVGPTADEVVGELEGSVLTLATGGFQWDDPSPDPPINWSYEVRQTEYLTCLGLLNYPDKPGPEGLALEPEAAASMPTVSADGLTYTFTIRPGFAFSPPSNEPVTAETFRSSIERALSPNLVEWAPGPQFLGDIVGARAFREGTASSVEGLAAAGDRLTIRLMAPSPDFLQRLSLPFYCPVPLGTPAVLVGLNTDPPVAGAGPYYLARNMRLRLIILKKNPNYHGNRPQPFDAIAIHKLKSQSDLLTEVKSGKIDGALLAGGEPLVGPGGDIDQAWGPVSDAAKTGDQRWFGAQRAGASYIALNPTRGPFKDPSVRKAVALALDRAALARIWPLGPGDNLLPPVIMGAEAADTPGPDLERARALVAGRRLTVNLATVNEGDCPPCQSFASEVAAQLKAIDITVHLHRSDDPWGEALAPGSEIDMFEAGIDSPYPDAATLLRDLADRSWIGKNNAREIQRVATLSGKDRIDGAAAVARRIVDSTLLIPYGHETYANYFSGRIGCGFVQPAIGAVDLLGLCIRDGASASPPP